MPRSRRADAREGKRSTFPIPLYDDMERQLDHALARTSMAKVEMVSRILKFFAEQDEGLQNIILGIVQKDRSEYAEMLLKRMVAERGNGTAPGVGNRSPDQEGSGGGSGGRGGRKS